MVKAAASSARVLGAAGEMIHRYPLIAENGDASRKDQSRAG